MVIVPCTNCGAPLQEGARFCSCCGQKTRFAPRSLREIFQEIVGRDYASDGRVWLTLRTLVVPGELTRDWFAGRQQRHIGPMRLLLLLLLAQVVALQLFTRLVLPTWTATDGNGESYVWLTRFGPDHGSLLAVRYPTTHHQINGGLLQPLLAPLAESARARVDGLTEVQFRELIIRGVLPATWHGKVFALPIVVLLLAAAYAFQGQRVARHAVFALHFGALMLAVDLLVTWPLFAFADVDSIVMAAGNYVGLGLQGLWFAVALLRVYGGPWWIELPRASLVLVATGACLPYVDATATILTLA